MKDYYLIKPLAFFRRNKLVGKAGGIIWLYKKRFTIPKTWVVGSEAFKEYMRGTLSLDSLESGIQNSLPEGTYAVRSSANIEDGQEKTLAGQFKTVLNVNKKDLLTGIRTVWDSVNNPGAISYIKISGLKKNIKMSVIIQQMIDSKYSGVSFSKNPMTGMNEVVVEAVEGTGETLLQDGVTPFRWVEKWGSWLEIPEKSPIPIELVQEVAIKTQMIARNYGKPVDLEWTYDGKRLYWLQLREITTLKNVNIYSNSISKEFLPGQIKPLVWSINIPLVNGAWIRLFEELTGKKGFDVNNLAKAFYYRAYFNMGVVGSLFEALGMPGETLELLLGLDVEGPEKPRFKPTIKTFVHLPRLLKFALSKVRLSKRFKEVLLERKGALENLNYQKIKELDIQSIFSEIEILYSLNQEIAYYNIVIPLIMSLYNRVLRNKLKKSGYDFEELDFGKTPRANMLDPNEGLKKLRVIYDEFTDENKEKLQNMSYENLASNIIYGNFFEKVHGFLDRFGHFSDSGNDFSSIPWRENPDIVLKMIFNYKTRKNKSRDLDKKVASDIKFRRKIMNVKKYSEYRDEISFLYTFGYGLFRVYFRELGKRFSSMELIENPEDIFYLTFDEIKRVQGEFSTGSKFKENVIVRRKEMEECREILPPDIIFGDEEPPPRSDSGSILKGTPSSRGYYRGIARIIRGTEEFDKLKKGDVLVIPYSDVAWTPLFIKAGAIVSEAGGILSHSSIVAREFGIPAVVSVSGACNIKDDTFLTVNGYTGEVVIHKE